MASFREIFFKTDRIHSFDVRCWTFDVRCSLVSFSIRLAVFLASGAARVKEDINVLFPIDRLLELVEAKVIGKLATNFYSFGFGGDLIQEFIGESDGSAHQLVQKLKADEVDCVLMIPA